MKEKDTTIKYTTQSGKNVTIIVHRMYGSYIEHHHDSENGLDYDTTEFADDQYLDVEIEGVCKFSPKYLPEMKHPKYDVYYLSNEHMVLAVPDDIAKQIFEAESEKLTDELSPIELLSIQDAKNAIKTGHMMPRAELRRKYKEYNNLYNEGAEGYNPYAEYKATEWVEEVKAKYPNEF